MAHAIHAHVTREHAVTAANGALITARRRISWPAIFAGVVVGLAAQFVLLLVGAGIGLGAVGPGGGATAAGIGFGAALYVFASALVCCYAGGWIAGREAQTARPSEGAVHGLLSWCVSVLLAGFLLTTAVGKVLGGGASVIARGLGMDSLGEARERYSEMSDERGGTPDQLAQTASSAAGAASKASLVAAGALIAEAIAAAIGGRAGCSRRYL